MSGQRNEWSDWGELWREQPVVDVARLQHQAGRKLVRMRGMVALELVTSVIAVAQCLRLVFHGTGRWQWWGVAALAFVVLLQWLYLHVRRGTWRASGSDARSLLLLTRERALGGIRLARINLWSTLALVVFSLAVAAPDLSPALWASDPHLKRLLSLQLAVNVPMVLVIVAACIGYMRRQRARLAAIETMLAPYDEAASAHRLE